MVGQRNQRELDRLIGVHEHRQLAGDAVIAVGVSRDPGAMTRDPAAALGRSLERARSGAPYLRGILVA